MKSLSLNMNSPLGIKSDPEADETLILLSLILFKKKVSSVSGSDVIMLLHTTY